MKLKKSFLALYGGKKTIRYNFPRHNSIGEAELKATQDVLKSGILSDYLASDISKFYGGRKVLEFEKKIKSYFKVKYAISVNSWTSGLFISVGALQLEKNSEVIVSPFTMSASIFTILHWGLKPVFADIDKNSFCLDPSSVEKKITKKTKAIILVDINGHPSDIKSFKKIAKKHNIKIIIDAAQSIGAKYIKENNFAGTVGDIGGFSLNVHKHINTGEGGLIVTNEKKLYELCCLIRNHGENMIGKHKFNYNKNTFGYNFRMGEIEAAIGIEQLKKLPKILKSIQKNAKLLSNGLRKLKGLQVPIIDKNCTHAFYNFPLVLDLHKVKKSRTLIVSALRSEGLPLGEGYLNIQNLPYFKNKEKIKNEFTINKTFNNSNAEILHKQTYFSFGICAYKLSNKDINLIIKSFKKVWNCLIE